MKTQVVAAVMRNRLYIIIAEGETHLIQDGHLYCRIIHILSGLHLHSDNLLLSCDYWRLKYIKIKFTFKIKV